MLKLDDKSMQGIFIIQMSKKLLALS